MVADESTIKQLSIITGISIPVLILLLGLLLPFEGKHNKAYVDPVGVVTICIGHTATAKAGQYKTDAQCYQLLASDLQDGTNAINNYVKVPLSNHLEAALRSFIFNVGSANFRKSTLLKKLNNADYSGACAELEKWIKTTDRNTKQVKILKGLINRRAAERNMCEAGL